MGRRVGGCRVGFWSFSCLDIFCLEGFFSFRWGIIFVGVVVFIGDFYFFGGDVRGLGYFLREGVWYYF